jgi:alpha-D-xyloside xylohydrolase
MRLDDGTSIFYRVDALTTCEPHGDHLLCRGTAVGKRPVVTDSKGALYSRMQELGGEITLTLRFDWVDPHILRVRIHEGDVSPAHQLPLLVAAPQPLPETAFTSGEAPLHCLRYMGERQGFQTVDAMTPYAELHSPVLTARIYQCPYRVELYTREGETICAVDGPERNAFSQNDDPGLSRVRSEADDRALFTTAFDLAYDEVIYGYGERFREFGTRRDDHLLWHGDALGTTTPRSYKNVPVFVSSRGYGVFINTAGAVRASVGTRTAAKQVLCVDDDVLEYFIIYGPALTDVLSRYTGLTGRAPVPPFWSFGAWFSRCSYTSAQEVHGIVETMRTRDIGVDVINLDPGWMDPEDWVCDLQFSECGFPDPAAFMREMREAGVRICLWQLPYIEKRSDLYPVLAEQGAFAAGTPFAETVIDYSSPTAVAAMRKEFRRLFDLGTAVIKTDFGEEAPCEGQYAGLPGRFMHNLYPLLYNQAVFNYTKEATGEGIVWARSAWAGSQRFPIHWGGDATSDYPNLASQLYGALNLGMSGFTYWSTDIAGITGVATPDLYVRWTQFGVFNSHMRFHSGYPVEPWEYGAEAEAAARAWIDLRYRLLPYLYAQAHRASAYGWPMMRPLVLHHQDDPNVSTLGDQFYLGDDLLIAPLLQAGGCRRVYLPAGDWYELLTAHCHHSRGEWIDWQGGLADYPVFVRGGSVIPLGPTRRHTGDAPEGPITLLYYPGPAGETQCIEPAEAVSIAHRPVADGAVVNVEQRSIARAWSIMPVADAAIAEQGGALGELLPAFPATALPPALDPCEIHVAW